MFIVTIDQRGSRVHGDKVDELLASSPVRELTPDRAGVVRAFERTVGDEVQAVLDDARVVVDLVLDIARRGGWSIGIGAGDVDEPLPESTRAGSGAAFILARTAVEAAKSRTRTVALAVRGADDGAGRDAEAVLVLAAATAARRSAAGWEVIDALAPGSARQEDVAATLGISQQAVSQRLRTALHDEELAARSAAARLLDLAQG
ncbi:hypothetical protein IC607_07290 [Cellulomonas sp. JH27-2]|uniref:hypothetical protein n=1 Tax=Cellulomonas sp. JH27-2 TaxID=2774139 RepID=UPI0017820526|nr:hypothetical protein [Cellulomonas sp. JH27-2]MBD8058768.1 hypothetical protein [Cellulomonas sp. JH27-2]